MALSRSGPRLPIRAGPGHRPGVRWPRALAGRGPIKNLR